MGEVEVAVVEVAVVEGMEEGKGTEVGEVRVVEAVVPPLRSSSNRRKKRR